MPATNRSLLLRTIFVLLAPLSVPLFALYLAYSNLVGVAYYLVCDMTIARLLGRPPRLTPTLFWIVSPLTVALAAPLLVVHLLGWACRTLLGGLVSIGRWQTGTRSVPLAGVVGAVWSTLFVGSVTFAVDSILAHAMIGQRVRGSQGYADAMRRHLRLRELSAEMQQERRRLLGVYGKESQGRLTPDPREFALADDDLLFEHLGFYLRARVSRIPWYYVVSEFSPDGGPHCEFMPGMLLLAILLLPRWVRRGGAVRGWASTALRMGAMAIAWWALLRWQVPDSPDSLDAWYDPLVAPLSWFGVSGFGEWAPQWYSLNAAIWLILLAAAGAIWWLAWRLRNSLELPRYYSAYLSARLLQRKRIAFFSVGAVTLCVAMLLIVISVMGGFVETIRERSNAVLTDLVLDGDLRGFPHYAAFIDRLRSWPEVRQATALIRAYGTLRFERGDTYPVSIVGISLSEYCRVNQFCNDLFYETHYPGTTTLGPVGKPRYGYDPVTTQPVLPEPYESAFQRWAASQPAEVADAYRRISGGVFPGPGVYELSENETMTPEIEERRKYPGMIIGRDIVARRRANGEYERSERFPRGCTCVVTLLPLSRTGAVITEAPPSPAFRYIDDSRTGVYEIDSKSVYVDFAVLQEKLGMNALPRSDGSGEAPARCSQIQIKLTAGVDVRTFKRRVVEAWAQFCDDTPGDAVDQAMMQSVRVSTWEELQVDYIAAIQKEKVLVVIMFSIISLVAVFLVLCIFYMIVIEKTRDIGIIKSVGGSASGVAAVFLTYGAAIGIVGSTLGSLIGAIFVRNINPLQDWLARLNPAWRVWSPETYSFDKIPDTVKSSDVILIAVSAVLASILGAAIPALRAARTWPVEALRYE